MSETTCPCGGLPTGAALGRCCGPALDGEAWPETAEALMRSRYTAFALLNTDHLFRTWHPKGRPTQVIADPQTTWVRLEVLDTADGGADDSEGIVEYRAHYCDPDGAGVLAERAHFARRAGRWVYTGSAEEAARG